MYQEGSFIVGQGGEEDYKMPKCKNQEIQMYVQKLC